MSTCINQLANRNLKSSSLTNQFWRVHQRRNVQTRKTTFLYQALNHHLKKGDKQSKLNYQWSRIGMSYLIQQYQVMHLQSLTKGKTNSLRRLHSSKEWAMGRKISCERLIFKYI
jgi:hypothetical protein